MHTKSPYYIIPENKKKYTFININIKKKKKTNSRLLDRGFLGFGGRSTSDAGTFRFPSMPPTRWYSSYVVSRKSSREEFTLHNVWATEGGGKRKNVQQSRVTILNK